MQHISSMLEAVIFKVLGDPHHSFPQFPTACGIRKSFERISNFGPRVGKQSQNIGFHGEILMWSTGKVFFQRKNKKRSFLYMLHNDLGWIWRCGICPGCCFSALGLNCFLTQIAALAQLLTESLLRPHILILVCIPSNLSFLTFFFFPLGSLLWSLNIPKGREMNSSVSWEDGNAPSMVLFKVMLDQALSTWSSCRCPFSLQGNWTRCLWRVPSN